jgi:hypothetical protein
MGQITIMRPAFRMYNGSKHVYLRLTTIWMRGIRLFQQSSDQTGVRAVEMRAIIQPSMSP